MHAMLLFPILRTGQNNNEELNAPIILPILLEL